MKIGNDENKISGANTLIWRIFYCFKFFNQKMKTEWLGTWKKVICITTSDIILCHTDMNTQVDVAFGSEYYGVP